MQFLHPEGDGVRILSLDGGDARCFSQLLILEELMHRLEYDHGRPVRPCEFFHSITGVGAAGVIAIFLGVLDMTISETMEAFIGICEKVFAPDPCDDRLRSERLVLATRKILDKLNVAHDTRLGGDIDRSAGCRVSICYSSASISGCRMFRNYMSKQPSYNPTIVEAVSACWATPGLFSSVYIGTPPQREEIISAVNGFNNPALQALQEARDLFGPNKPVSAFLSLGSGKNRPVSIHSDRFLHDTVQQTEITEENIEREFGHSGVYYRLSPEYTTQSGSFDILDNQFGSINSYTRAYLERAAIIRSVESFLIASTRTSNVDLTFKGKARPGKLVTGLGQVPTTVRLSREERSILSDLKVKGIDSGSPLQGCMPGTRKAILGDVHKWTVDLNAPNILWLKGYPGVGKSAIATELVDQLATLGRLGSSFFFQRQKAAELTPHALWRTVAHDLARRHPSVRTAVIAKLEEDIISPGTSNLESLFHHFIRESLTETTGIPNARLPVVVIDALDECGGLEGQHSAQRKGLLKTFENWSQLPAKFKLIVTSRGENDIKRFFSTTNHHLIEILAGENVDTQSSEDIRMFLIEELQKIVAPFALSLPQTNWPDAQTIGLLVYMAGGLFIWAQTVIKFISLGEPRRRLGQVLEGRAKGNIDDLYDQILRTAFSSEEDIQDFRIIAGAIILMKAPLPFTSLAYLLSMEKSNVENICIRLQSVLEYHNNLQFYHQSFVDFLLDRDRCTLGFAIERDCENRKLTLACLRVLNVQLKFNICGVESSYFRNADISDLASKVDANIPPHLLYSSLWWTSHLAETTFDSEIFGQIQDFMHKQFLFWLEILSISQRVNMGSNMLLLLIDWILPHSHPEAVEFARDMHKFVVTFASPISQSVAHIYLSALPFSPPVSVVWKQYIPEYAHTLTFQSGGLSYWPVVWHVLTGHDAEVNAVAFAPDGKRIVSGSSDHTIRVWDTETGAAVTSPFKGHRAWITSVKFSPDGKRIVSGSDDQTIRVWDAETGTVVASPFEGHSDLVTSVRFSPNGKRIVSSSTDKTIRVWDAETGAVVAGPLNGHNDSVTSVEFSPDGRRIISGSDDKTIRVWDAETGAVIAGPFKGHNDSVTSVGFSPDGKRVVSGSEDETIRVWDTETGVVLAGPFRGHNHVVTSVGFSPDGKCIVSGSYDRTIRVWDAETGVVVTGPFEGHSDWVVSVEFSPDGKRIVSGSDDKTIRVWDAKTSVVIDSRFEGHDGSVNSVGFSPDGKRIVSGSDDKTVRVWNAETGAIIAGPFEGHNESVMSVDFSPDGKRIVSGSGSEGPNIRIWDAETGAVVAGPLSGHNGSVMSVRFSPDGKRIISGSHDRTIRVWDAETGSIIAGPFKGHSDWVTSVEISPDGKRIISASDDQTIRVWDANTGAVVSGPLQGHDESVSSVGFSPDGKRIISGSHDQTIRVWDAQTGAVIAGPFKGHSDWVTSVGFSPDGKHIVSGSDDQTIRIWNVETGEVVAVPLQGHDGSVSSVEFSPDGRRVASSSQDKTIRVWDIKTSAVITGYCKSHGNQPSSIGFSSDGKHIASSTWEGVIGEGDGLSQETLDLSSFPPNFGDSLKVEDGWVLGPRSELLFWVPPALRLGLNLAKNVLIITKDIVTKPDLTSFVSGKLWNLCKTRRDPKS